MQKLNKEAIQALRDAREESLIELRDAIEDFEGRYIAGEYSSRFFRKSLKRMFKKARELQNGIKVLDEVLGIGEVPHE